MLYSAPCFWSDVESVSRKLGNVNLELLDASTRIVKDIGLLFAETLSAHSPVLRHHRTLTPQAVRSGGGRGRLHVSM